MIGVIDDDVGEPRQHQEPDRRIGKPGVDDADLRMIAQATRRLRHRIPEGAGGSRVVAGDAAGGLQEITTRLRREDGGGQREDSSMTDSISVRTLSRS